MALTTPSNFTRAFKGKRVVLVGPANYLDGQRRGDWIDDHDLVVKLNWGETLPDEDYGRTDVLIKRLLKLGHADEALVQSYIEAELKWLVAVETRANAPRKKYLENLLGQRVKWFIDDKTRGEIMHEIASAPLVGMIAVRMLLRTELASLDVVGLDFYATGYNDDYGGKPYRQEMKRREGAIGSRHDGPEQLRWLIQQREKDSRLRFDDALEELVADLNRPPPTPKRLKKARRRANAAAAARPAAQRFVWTPGNVSAKNAAAMSIRTFIEHRQLRTVLEPLGTIETAAEVGAGFGRMLVQLADLVGDVTAFEREPGLVGAGQKLVPAAEWFMVPKLTELPGEADSQDLVMAFTVLQHMSDDAASKTIAEMVRLARRYVLIVEDTDPAYRMNDKGDATHFTIGRPVEWYAAAVGEGFDLDYSKREVEPGYKGQPDAFVGHYMLFRRSQR